MGAGTLSFFRVSTRPESDKPARMSIPLVNGLHNIGERTPSEIASRDDVASPLISPNRRIVRGAVNAMENLSSPRYLPPPPRFGQFNAVRPSFGSGAGGHGFSMVQNKVVRFPRERRRLFLALFAFRRHGPHTVRAARRFLEHAARKKTL